MNLLYVSFWGLYDPLSQATVYPNIPPLSRYFNGGKVFVLSVERAGTKRVFSVEPPRLLNVEYLELKSWGPGYFAKFIDFVWFPIRIIQIIKHHKIDFALGRGAPAGGLIFLASRITRTRYYVESFEPHADYMLESGVWKRFGLKYLFQKYLEYGQRATAAGLMTVSDKYRKLLQKVPNSKQPVITVPCIVDLAKFRFKEDRRAAVRADLKIPMEALVGIYVGKFGGIYFDLPDALSVFSADRLYFGSRFYLIVLTDLGPDLLFEAFINTGACSDFIRVKFVSNEQVPDYLSASDFGYALIKPSPSKQYCSPIKVGEYWANGLPVVMPEGIGDDSVIMSENNCGCPLNSTTYDREKLLSIIPERERIMMVARAFRSENLRDNAYNLFFVPRV
jgi:hypothetical protein